MNADGSNQTRLTNNSAIDEYPAFSPDGSRIAFISYRNGNGDVYVMRSDGSNQVRLTTDAQTDMASHVTDPQTGIRSVCGTVNSLSPFVLASGYNFAGFFQPVDNLPTLNIATAVSSIPVKFSLGGNQGLGIFAAGYPKSSPIACDASEPGAVIEETVNAGGSSLSYDATSDQYSYIWKTDNKWRGTCRMLVVKCNDGSQHFAKFRFR
jgi:hypothetical protein